jgi:hypothetical protein
MRKGPVDLIVEEASSGYRLITSSSSVDLGAREENGFPLPARSRWKFCGGCILVSTFLEMDGPAVRGVAFDRPPSD